MSQTPNKGLAITGADGQIITIPAGEYYLNAKARPRRLMRNSLSSEARRVYACLEMATMAFQTELAVKLDKGRRVPLTPTDIVDQTGLSKQHVRRAIEELEEQGLAERRATSEKGLTKGHVEIYSWAEPRTPKVKNSSQRAATIPEWFPTSWEPIRTLITRYKYKLPQDLEAARGYIPALETAARDYQRAEKVVTELLDGVCAREKTERINRKEITERTLDITSPCQSVSPLEEERPTDRQEEIEKLLVETLEAKLPGEVPGPTLCKRIDAKLRDAPLPVLRKRIEQRISKITSMGMVEALADDVGKSWSARKRGPWDLLLKPPPDLMVEETYLQRMAREIDEKRKAANNGGRMDN